MNTKDASAGFYRDVDISAQDDEDDEVRQKVTRYRCIRTYSDDITPTGDAC